MKWLVTLLLVGSSFALGKGGNSCSYDELAWWKRDRAQIEALGQNIPLNAPVSIKGLSVAEKKQLFKELQEKGAYVDIHTPDEQAYEQGLVDGVGKVETYLKSAKFVRLRNGFPEHLPDIESFMIRGFAPKDSNESQALQILPVSLPTEKKLSGLPPKDLAILEKHARDVISVQELLENQKHKEFADGAVVLGLGKPPYGDLATALKMEEYGPIYDKHHIKHQISDSPNAPDHVDLFMNLIKGRKIVFLLPRNFLDYQIDFSQSDFGDKNITRREYEWLMSQPKSRLANVTFVLGAYDCLSGGDLSKANEKTLQNVLKNPATSTALKAPVR